MRDEPEMEDCKEFMYDGISLVFAVFYQLPDIIQQQGSCLLQPSVLPKACYLGVSAIERIPSLKLPARPPKMMVGS